MAAPFASAKAPAFTDSHTYDAATKTATISKHGGVSKLRVEPALTAAGITVTVEQRPDEVEYSWVLASRPMTNVFSLTLTLTNCEYYYQPPLTEEYTAASAEARFGEPCAVTASAVTGKSGKVYVSRPADIVGSYAVYSTYSDGVYETSKVAHIYRPHVTDAAGKQTWGTMKIEGDTLTVTVDQKWLDAAKYPVIVDPTIGYTGAGGSTEAMTINDAYGTAATTPASGTPYAITIHAYVSEDAPAHMRLGIWAGTDGGALLTSDTAATPGAWAWETVTLTPRYQLAASTSYVIGLIPDNSDLNMRYDVASGTSYIDITNSYAAPQAFGWSTTTTPKRYSLYVTIEYDPVITSSVISDMDDTNNLYTMKKYYTFTTVITDGSGATDVASISVRGAQGASVRWMVNATTLDGVPAYAIATGASTIDLDAGGCSFTEVGNDGTLVLSIRFEWDATSEADCDLEVWAEDAEGNTVGWTTVHSNYFDVISRLVTRDFTGNLTSTTINMPVEITGRVRYATTVAGDNSSTSYPPDAQFTQVKLYTGGGDYAGADAAIANGFYNITVTTPATLGAVYYYTWIDMAGDYVDGYAPDGDYVAISVGASFSIIKQVNEGFTFFGLTGAVLGQIVPTITAFATWFADSATAIINMVSATMTLIIFVSGTVTAWFTRMVNTVVNICTIVGSLFDGTYTAGMIDLWTVFKVSTWIDVVPIIAFMWWIDNIPRRAKSEGISQVERVIRDIQIVSYVVGEVWNWSFTVFNFVANMVMTFVGVVTG